MHDLIAISNRISALEKKARKPKEHEIFKDPATGEWMIMIYYGNLHPEPLSKYMNINGDKVDIWYFRDPPWEHGYWESYRADDEDEKDHHIAEDYGRYFLNERDALKDAAKWNTGKVVQKATVDLKYVKRSGKYKRNFVLQTNGPRNQDVPIDPKGPMTLAPNKDVLRDMAERALYVKERG